MKQSAHSKYSLSNIHHRRYGQDAVKKRVVAFANKQVKAPVTIESNENQLTKLKPSTSNSEISHLQSQNNSLKNEIASKDQYLCQQRQQIQNLQARSDELSSQKLSVHALIERTKLASEDRLARLRHQLDITSTRLMESQNILACGELKLSKLQKVLTETSESLSTHQEELDKLNGQKTQYEKIKLDKLTLTFQMGQALLEIQNYENRCIQLLATIENRRKYLYNHKQDIRGNIRVFCRIRPLQDNEELVDFEIVQSKMMKLKSAAKLNATGTAEIKDSYEFHFDHVFGTDDTQEMVFEEISLLVQSALDGFNVSIFAYGQTGTGKTYTMMHGIASSKRSNLKCIDAGQDGCDPQQGVIPRSALLIFQSVESLQSKGWDYTVFVSCLEIYNEQVRDLLNEIHLHLPGIDIQITDKTKESVNQSDTHCDVKLDEKGNTVVTNLKSVRVQDFSTALKLVHYASSFRTSSTTSSNVASSRSHCIFQFVIRGENRYTRKVVNGTMSLIDLAGSERCDKSQCIGDRLKETQSINKSLSCLADVIAAIGRRNPTHTPFRNSKLTMLLKDSLGGNSKTIMFVNISPSIDSLRETVNSLRFASKVNSCTPNESRKTPSANNASNNRNLKTNQIRKKM